MYEVTKMAHLRRDCEVPSVAALAEAALRAQPAPHRSDGWALRKGVPNASRGRDADRNWKSKRSDRRRYPFQFRLKSDNRGAREVGQEDDDQFVIHGWSGETKKYGVCSQCGVP